MDNLTIARVLDEVADLLELRGDNPFKIRAYRNAAETVSHSAEPLAPLTALDLQRRPGIGKDLSARIVEIAQTGTCGIHQELAADYPPTLLDLLRLQGVGPKTVSLLHQQLGIASITQLEEAAKTGRLRGLKGMGPRKEELVLKALAERRERTSRHTLVSAAATANSLRDYLVSHHPTITFDIVGSVRRGVETCGDIDILAVGDVPNVMDTFTAYPLVERVLGRGDTKSSLLLRGAIQADLRLVSPDSRGAALQYFTGSKAHNIALRDRALARGLKLNEYGLFRVEDETRVAGDTEASIYQALGLGEVPPELREHRGELEAAQTATLPTLLALSDLRGDLHMHTTESDGKDTLEAMVLAAKALGREYIAITDHSKSLAMANGLDEKRALAHAARIRSLNARVEGITVLAGIECDILANGTLDLDDECLAQLDVVIASVHSQLRQDAREITDRVLRALENPWVDILAHPTGRLLLKREPSAVAIETIADAAARTGVALEINCLPDRLDLSDINARLARERGARLVISSDAHSIKALHGLTWGVTVARRAWATAADVLTTLPLADLTQSLRRHQRGAK